MGTILHYLTRTLTPYLNLSHLTKGHQTRSCWNEKRENLHKNEMTAIVLKLKDERKLYRDLKRKLEKKSLHHPKSLSSSANFLAPYTKPLERKRSVSVVSFFGPNVEPSSLLPRPKTATPVVPSSRKNSKQHKMKKFVSDCDHYPLLFFFFFKSFTFFLKIVTTFSFQLLISRSVLFPLSPPCFRASEMADRFSSSP